MRKRFNVSDIKLDRLDSKMTLSEKVEALYEVLAELSGAVQIDLLDIDLENFSGFGISQLENRARASAKKSTEEDFNIKTNTLETISSALELITTEILQIEDALYNHTNQISFAQKYREDFEEELEKMIAQLGVSE